MYNIKSSSHLLLNPEIMELTKKVLNESDINIANEIVKRIISKDKNTKQEATDLLRAYIGTKPKRPIYYLHHELQFLPNQTRGAMRYLGDYIDHLIKYTAQDLVNPIKRFLSLGQNTKVLKGKIPDNLYHNLVEYNKLLYVPAKHEFNTRGNDHLFSCREIVYTCFITLKLAERIKAISHTAKDYSENKLL